ncbi:LOW QUALITY PROTEIN: C-type lectin domain family 18 member B-like [Lampetra planeri]
MRADGTKIPIPQSHRPPHVTLHCYRIGLSTPRRQQAPCPRKRSPSNPSTTNSAPRSNPRQRTWKRWSGTNPWLKSLTSGRQSLAIIPERQRGPRQRSPVNQGFRGPEQLEEVEDIRLGVNLHRAPHGVVSFAGVLASWFSEGQNYDYARSGCAHNRTCRHYTQMVWASASRVGCAKRWCRDPGSRVEAFACVYLPGGNWLLDGKTIAPYKAGDWCSLCTSVKSGCFKHQGAGGLCEVPQNRCRMNCGRHGHLDSSSCRCSCASGFSGKYCQVKCSYPCVHGRYREEECSCVCDLGYGGLTCAERAEFPYHSCALRVDDDCLSVSDDSETFYTARNQCQGRGGTLVQIESQREQDLLSFYLLRATDSNDVTGLEPESNSFWIGLTYKVSKGVFRWDDGRAVNFSSFALGQPDSHG